MPKELRFSVTLDQPRDLLIAPALDPFAEHGSQLAGQSGIERFLRQLSRRDVARLRAVLRTKAAASVATLTIHLPRSRATRATQQIQRLEQRAAQLEQQLQSLQQAAPAPSSTTSSSTAANTNTATNTAAPTNTATSNTTTTTTTTTPTTTAPTNSVLPI